jgi:hypothetical protein
MGVKVVQGLLVVWTCGGPFAVAYREIRNGWVDNIIRLGGNLRRRFRETIQAKSSDNL